MNAAPAVSRVLLTILHNQARRVEAALAGLDEGVFRAAPGGDARSIFQIGAHLVHLQKFQLTLLGSPLAEQVREIEDDCGVAELRARLAAGFELVAQAVAGHDEADWFAAPAGPRPGPWADEPTLQRFVRPLNDLVSHVGSIRAIRRILGSPAEQTQ